MTKHEYKIQVYKATTAALLTFMAVNSFIYGIVLAIQATRDEEEPLFAGLGVAIVFGFLAKFILMENTRESTRRRRPGTPRGSTKQEARDTETPADPFGMS